jgi:hypothetical protein
MPKNSWNDYSTTAASNTDVHSVSIAEGMAPSDVNNAMRELMVDAANFDQGNVTLTSALAVASGGTGAATHTANNVLVGAGTSAVTSVAPSTSGNVLTSNGTVWASTAAAASAGKNMLINGAMTVNQRGSTTATVNTENLDRFASTLYNAAGSAVATVTKDSDSPTGFGSSMKFDVTTIATGGGDYNHVRQRIEGQNLQHLKYGTADALTCTFSFWFKTTITGIYSAIAYHMDATQTYIREFTVASADTWEFFQVTFPGYTATAFDNDANASLEIGITLASDSATASSNNVWQAGGDTGGSTNQVNGLSSTSNNIYTTGWQFEVGSAATDFEHEDYGTTLKKCRRYFQTYNAGAGASATTDWTDLGTVSCPNTTQGIISWHFDVEMRTGPTLAATTSGAGSFLILTGTANRICTAITIDSYTRNWFCPLIFTAPSLVAGQGAQLRTYGGSPKLDFSAEI